MSWSLRLSILCIRRHSSSASANSLDLGNKSATLNRIRAPHPADRRNVDLVIKQQPEEKEAPESDYNTLHQLGIQTHDKTHTFSVDSEKAVKLIKMGIINKHLSIQYCHYLLQLNTTLEGDLAKHYSAICYDLALYLCRSNDGMSISAISNLLIRVAETNLAYCCGVVKLILSRQDLIDQLSKSRMSSLLRTCYTFKQWSLASDLIKSMGDRECLTALIIDNLVTCMYQCSTDYSNSSCPEEKERIKKEVFDHFFVLIEKMYDERIQFITKNNLEFEQALKQFDVSISKNPQIKLSGRCTTCKSTLPLYDDEKITRDLNSAVRDLLHERVTGDIPLHAQPMDIENFEKYIKNLIAEDNKPIDVVIDGLNVAYRSSTGFVVMKQKYEENLDKTWKFHSKSSQAQVLMNTILRADLLTHYRKILVVGRHHMYKWPRLMHFFGTYKIHHYFSSEYTKDDLIQLYAATLHPKTILISGDFLRDHIALMKPAERVYLERWIDTHQAWVQHNTLKVIFPTPYEKIASVNKATGTFHVPVIDFSKLSTIADREPPPHLNPKMTTWICGQMRAKS